jgi:hypothetical protein
VDGSDGGAAAATAWKGPVVPRHCQDHLARVHRCGQQERLYRKGQTNAGGVENARKERIGMPKKKRSKKSPAKRARKIAKKKKKARRKPATPVEPEAPGAAEQRERLDITSVAPDQLPLAERK